MTKKETTTVAAASMSAGANGGLGAQITGKAIEQAMAAATLKALEDGVTDPEEILELKLAARAAVKAGK